MNPNQQSKTVVPPTGTTVPTSSPNVLEEVKVQPPQEVEKVLTEEEIRKATIVKLKESPIHFGKTVRLGSRKIIIKQVEKFSLLPSDPAANALREEITKKIGSKFAKGSQDVIRGLSPEEEKYYLPRYIGHSSSTNDWNYKAKQWWAEYTISVPISGLEIEAGFHITDDDDGKPVIEPISLDGYIKYNFCLVNSQVATPDIENTFHYDFQMIDKAKDEQNKEDNFLLIKSVLRTYNMLIQSEDQKEKSKIDWILETEYNISTLNLSPLQKEMKLKEMMEQDPDKFKRAVSDPQLEMKAFIRKAVETGSIIKDGESYFLDSQPIGTGTQQVLAYFANQVNQSKKIIVQERIKNAL